MSAAVSEHFPRVQNTFTHTMYLRLCFYSRMSASVPEQRNLLRRQPMLLSSGVIGKYMCSTRWIWVQFWRYENESMELSISIMESIWKKYDWILVKKFSYESVPSFFIPASVERNSYVRIGRDVDATSFLCPRRIRTSGKLSYGPK